MEHLMLGPHRDALRTPEEAPRRSPFNPMDALHKLGWGIVLLGELLLPAGGSLDKLPEAAQLRGIGSTEVELIAFGSQALQLLHQPHDGAPNRRLGSAQDLLRRL